MSDDPFSRKSATEAADRGELGDWVAAFLGSPGSDNAPLGAKLNEGTPSWSGPVRVPLGELNRLAGPEGDPVLEVVDDDEWRDDVDDMRDKIAKGWEPPPLIVTFRDDQLVLEDGNHRAESLRRAGEDEGWAIIRFEDDEQRARFHATPSPGR